MFPQEMIEEFKKNGMKYDEKVLIKYMGGDWKNKCERSLHLAK